MTTLPSRILQTIRGRNLLKPGNTVIVGVSGGADSCALLDLLAHLSGISLSLVAAHLNHGLRGADSDADEDFCRDRAEFYKIPFISRRIDVAAYAATHRLSLEDAGRQARRAFFNELLVRHNGDAVALGHHRDDQVETFFMRLLRGAGTTGLAGMAFSSTSRIIRPLLDVTRSEIENYLTLQNLSWREDASNRDTTFLRNRIRHELLPILEQYNPAIRERIAATSCIVGEENELLESLAQLEFSRLVCRQMNTVGFDVPALKGIHPALLKRIIRIACSDCTGNLENLSQVHISDALALLADGRPNRAIDLPGGLVIRREYGQLLFSCSSQPDTVSRHVAVEGPGQYRLWDDICLEVSLTPCPDRLDKTPVDTVIVDLGKAPFPWHVRTYKPGDRVRPLGMTGRKKVKDIYIDSKIPLRQRHQIPLLFCGDVLMWVAGVTRSSHALVDDMTQNFVTAKLTFCT